MTNGAFRRHTSPKSELVAVTNSSLLASPIPPMFLYLVRLCVCVFVFVYDCVCGIISLPVILSVNSLYTSVYLISIRSSVPSANAKLRATANVLRLYTRGSPFNSGQLFGGIIYHISLFGIFRCTQLRAISFQAVRCEMLYTFNGRKCS